MTNVSMPILAAAAAAADVCITAPPRQARTRCHPARRPTCRRCWTRRATTSSGASASARPPPPASWPTACRWVMAWVGSHVYHVHASANQTTPPGQPRSLPDSGADRLASVVVMPRCHLRTRGEHASRLCASQLASPRMSAQDDGSRCLQPRRRCRACGTRTRDPRRRRKARCSPRSWPPSSPSWCAPQSLCLLTFRCREARKQLIAEHPPAQLDAVSSSLHKRRPRFW